ncbi:small ribosomal subunit protein mS37 isoform X2 [Camelus dromedarius]|uniref:small ribosomal subunit protein mS37 isoform X2 n=1 Tax=Camelus dromedarius TaxID=9838 RepID=UPI00057BB1D3|nr:coiled-coil-helix-coiled-coil-helix domain-containing protein 1 isoform X2 [Camelus dromedarius]
MATPSLRGRLARFGNPRKPILKPKKPLVLANHVGERRREKGEATCITEMSVMMACWKQNEFRDEACRKEIQDFFDCASRAEVIESSWATSPSYPTGGIPGTCLVLQAEAVHC